MNLIYIYIYLYIYTYIAFLYNKLICIWVYKLPIYECHLERLLYSFSNVCRDFTICFPQNILDQGDIQMRVLKISPPSTNPLLLLGDYMAITLAMLATFLPNSFRIHPMASLSVAAFLSAGTCECIISNGVLLHDRIPKRGIVITKLCWDKTSQHSCCFE